MISILLATYNGEKYLKEQLNSLLSQTIKDFRAFINDDCSTDNTYSILEEYKNKYPEIFFISQNKINTGKAKLNFIKMMIEHKDEYIMLCDQDDIWLPEKIEVSLKRMKQLENKYGKYTPLLVHTDLRVVDKDLNSINASFMNLINIDFTKNKMNNIIVQNILTGCTAMYNLKLSELINTQPIFFVIHDWWLIFIACAFGKISFIETPTIFYRQHDNNSIGAVNFKTFSYILNRFLNKRSIEMSINETYKQAESFLDTYSMQLTGTQKEFLNRYINIPKHKKLKKCIEIIKLKAYMGGLVRKLAHFFYI